VADNEARWDSAVEVDQTSTVDASSFDTGDDDFIKEGIGTFIATYGASVPVRLNSLVTRIAWGTPDDVTVTLATHETFHARRILSTVSTGILASGKITFEPELPAWKKEAIAGLPMGLLNKVVIEFTKDIFGSIPQSTWVAWDGPGHDNVGFVIKPHGAPIAVGFYGGDQAKEFEKNDDAALAHVKDALREMFGSEVDTTFKTSAITHWGSTPWSLGSYSAARPGGSKYHAVLAQPVDDRVFFAGEACGAPIHNGSLAGAYESALQSAGLLIQSLDHK
jgi:monoamine oxidase